MKMIKFKARIRRIKAIMKRPLSHFLNYTRNEKLLESRGWYRTLSGGWADSHGAQTITPEEVCSMTPEELNRLL